MLVACLALADASASPAQGRLAQPVASGQASDPILRLETFTLELERPFDPVLGRRPVPEAVGWVEWRRRRVRGGVQLECESVFPHAKLRVLHVESLTDFGPRLVWREFGSGHGRTLIADWPIEGRELRLTEWSVGGSITDRLGTAEGAVMPLYLAELAREGAVTYGSFLVLEPLARRLEPLELRTSYGFGPETRPEASRELRALEAGASSGASAHAGASAGAGARIDARRRVEWRRSDGGLAGRFEFDGDRLEAFQWQEGGLWARRSSASSHRALVESFEPPAEEEAD